MNQLSQDDQVQSTKYKAQFLWLERAVRLELTILDLQSSALAAWRRAQIGTEGEIRTLESSLEDSHVSGYITSA